MSPAGDALLMRAPGHIHMAGIGGVGMAGLALLLRGQSWRMSGCDAAEGSLISWLREQEIPVEIGHHVSHIAAQTPDAVIRSPAVRRDEPELMEATRRGIPVLDRGEVLPALLRRYRTAAVAGTHGKTTTSSMMAWMLEQAGQNPSFCIGGVCPNLGAVARAASTEAMVVEADESDGTLRWYRPDIAVITSTDLDHVDYFQDQAALTAVYQTFAGQARVTIRPHSAGLLTPKDITFGFEPEATWSARDVELAPAGSRFTLLIRGQPVTTISLGISGAHNVLNALAAAAAADVWGVSMRDVVAALATFRLPRRRFEDVARGRGLRVISDYAHHPVEIAALLAQARLLKPRRIIAVFQPHRFSRTRAFKKEFAAVLSSVDYLVLAPVYAASEPPVPGGTSRDLWLACGAIRGEGVDLAESLEDAWQKLKAAAQDGDLILLIGAGDVENIGAWAARAWGAAAG